MSGAEMREVVLRLAPRTAHRVCDELSITKSATQLLIADESVPIEIRSKIALIQSQIEHVADIARQFLYITGNREPPRTVLDIREILLEIESLLQRLLGDGIQLQISFDCKLWPVKADADNLVSIFCALAANSRDAMLGGGSICIRASRLTKADCLAEPRLANIANDYILVEFSDTGIGIPNSVADQIFQPFFTTKGVGCGFGLTGVYSKIKKMNGHILVNSTLGCGATFQLLLPRHLG